MNALAIRHMKQAAERVAEVKDKPYKDIYGGLCHSFPVMVRQCGLAQAVAFSIAKAGDGDARKQAHTRVLDDVKALLGREASSIVALGAMEYVVASRRVLGAWIYYKRFAESILNVETAQAAEEETP